MDKFTSPVAQIELNRKYYSCQVIDGVRYVDGMPLAQFLKDLDTDSLREAAKIGKEILTNKYKRNNHGR